MNVRLFCMFVHLVLYNSELWALTSTMNNKLDAFHRRILRYAMGFHWPKKISNEDLYRMTKPIPLSRIIQKERLSWFGHLMMVSYPPGSYAAARHHTSYNSI